MLDLAEVSGVDAAGLGTLIWLQRWAKGSGTKLKLINVMPRVEEVLDITRLKSSFEICSVEEVRTDHLGALPT